MKKKRNPDILISMDERLTRVETDIDWIKKKINCIDKKIWWLLTTIIIALITLLIR